MENTTKTQNAINPLDILPIFLGTVKKAVAEGVRLYGGIPVKPEELEYTSKEEVLNRLGLADATDSVKWESSLKSLTNDILEDQRAQAHRQHRKEAEASVAKMSLPKLEGTPRQVAWAKDIRAGRLAGFQMYLIQGFRDNAWRAGGDWGMSPYGHGPTHFSEKELQLLQEGAEELKSQTSAKWFIEEADSAENYVLAHTKDLFLGAPISEEMAEDYGGDFLWNNGTILAIAYWRLPEGAARKAVKQGLDVLHAIRTMEQVKHTEKLPYWGKLMKMAGEASSLNAEDWSFDPNASEWASIQLTEGSADHTSEVESKEAKKPAAATVSAEDRKVFNQLVAELPITKKAAVAMYRQFFEQTGRPEVSQATAKSMLEALGFDGTLKGLTKVLMAVMTPKLVEQAADAEDVMVKDPARDEAPVETESKPEDTPTAPDAGVAAAEIPTPVAVVKVDEEQADTADETPAKSDAEPAESDEATQPKPEPATTESVAESIADHLIWRAEVPKAKALKLLACAYLNKDEVSNDEFLDLMNGDFNPLPDIRYDWESVQMVSLKELHDLMVEVAARGCDDREDPPTA